MEYKCATPKSGRQGRDIWSHLHDPFFSGESYAGGGAGAQLVSFCLHNVSYDLSCDAGTVGDSAGGGAELQRKWPCSAVFRWRIPLQAALPDGWGNEAAHLAGNGAGTLYLRERILQLADRDRLNTSWIRGGSSGVLILAEFPAENESKEDIVIHWLYAVNFTALPGVSLPVSGQVCRRMWTGSVRQNAERDVESDNIVYVAENGKVCHRSRDCTYLKLSVKSAGLDEIPALRNQDGAKYYPCERCVLHGECSSPVYITEEGNRYHVDSNCGGLRRMVDSVPAGETSLPLCSRCGGGS